MTYEEIKRIVAGGESRTVELKKTTGELKDAMHTACAMLNTEGGWVVFGVAPKPIKILGQQVSDDTRREIAHALSLIEPQVDVRVEYIDVPDREGNKVIAIYFEAFAWGKTPYTYHGRPYYKVESTTKEMPRAMFEDRLRAAKPKFYAWERQKADRIDLTDLNEDRIRGVVRLGVERGRMVASAVTEPMEKILDNLQLLADGKPNNAAAMLFGTNIYEYPQFRLRMARFRGTDKNSFLDDQRAEGNFFDLLDAGMTFLFKWLPQSGEIKGLMREERLEIPAAALREALINSLCHRQWEKYNMTIGISIYDDRVEIENPGLLPPPLTPETIKEPHISIPYNPIIANVLYKTTFLENWGSGVRRIVDACREQGIQEPIWSENQGCVVVTFIRRNGTQSKVTNGTQTLNDKTENQQVEQQSGTQGKVSNGTQAGALKSHSRKDKTVIKNLDEWIESMIVVRPKITTGELAQLSGWGVRTIKRHIAQMPHIKYVGSGYTGHWEVTNKEN